jgi:hypothetical protein
MPDNNPPLLTRRRLVGFALEAEKGTAVAPTTGIAAPCYDVRMAPDGWFSDGERRPAGHLGTVLAAKGAKRATCSFRMELVPGSPFLDLISACGYKKTVTSAQPTSNFADQKTVTLYVWEDGRVKKMKGAAGTFTITADNGARIFVEFEFTGLWDGAADAAFPDYTPVNAIGYRSANATFTVAAAAYPQIASWTFDANTTVDVRETVENDGGIFHYFVGDRGPTLTVDPEARKVAHHDVFGLLDASTLQAISLSFPGPVSGVFSIVAPKAQRTEVEDGERGSKITDGVTFQLHVNAENGDDEVVLTDSGA